MDGCVRLIDTYRTKFAADTVMLSRRSLGKQAAAGAVAALGMVGAAEAVMATSGQISGVADGYIRLGLGGNGQPYQLDVLKEAIRIMRDDREPQQFRILAARYVLDAGWHI